MLSNTDSLEQKVKYSMNLALETVYESPLVTKFFPKYCHSEKKVTNTRTLILVEIREDRV